MSTFSTFPELEGIAFPASTARELAEKRVLQQRAEAERIRQIELARIEAEEKAKREKQERIEKKRKEAEVRLWERAQQQAREDDQAAEQIRQERLERERKAEEAERAAAEQERIQREKLQRAASLKRKQVEEQERRKREEAEAEREKKRQERIRKQQESERDSEMRWLREQVKQGNVKVTKLNGVFTLDAIDLTAAETLESMGWVAFLDDLPGINYDVVEEPEPEESKPKVAFIAPAKKVSGPKSRQLSDVEQRWLLSQQAQSRGPTATATEVLGNFQVKQWNEFGDLSLDTLVSNLDGTSTHTQAEALIHLYSFHATLLASEGVEGFQAIVADPAFSQEFARLPRILADKLEDAPGNVLVLTILGLLYYAGTKELARTISALDVIPVNFDEWTGWVVGARLFFEFYSWWNASSQRAPIADWSLADEAFLEDASVPDKISEGAKRMIEGLAFTYLPHGSEYIATEVERKLGLIYSRTRSANGEIGNVLRKYQDNVEIAQNENSSEVTSQTQEEWNRLNFQVREAERTKDAAEQRMHQINIDVQNSKSFLKSVDTKKLSLAQRLTSLRLQEDAVKREMEDIEAHLHAIRNFKH